MSEQGKRRAVRKRKPEEHIIPITLDDSADNETVVVSSSSDKTIIDDENPTDDTICDSVQQMSLQTSEVVPKEEPDDKVENQLPSVNVPEKIIIIYDCVSEQNTPGYELNEDSYCVNGVVKRCLRMYIKNKNRIDKKHEFALIALRKDRVDWVKGFTGNVSQIKTELENLTNSESEDISDAYLDLDEIFHVIKARVKIPTTVDVQTIPPAFVVRVVFVYTRSSCVPVFTNKEAMRDVIDSPYFNFDVLMVHEDPDQENNSKTVFERLAEIDGKGTSYCFSLGKDYSKLHVGMAKLLAHPLQRPRQGVGNYCINC